MKRLFTLLLIALTTLSCEMTDEKLDDLLDKRDWVVFADGTELTANVPSKQTVLNYKFESTLDWEVKTDAEWLEIDPTSGKAGKDIKIQIKVLHNKDKEGRTGYVDLTLSNEESYRITVNQAGEGEENDEGDENENEGTIVDVPANQIWYTSTDGKIVEPYSGENNNNADAPTTFGVNIVSNTYKDGKGVITFSGDVTIIGEWAFYYCTSLASVTIPDSITKIGYAAFAGCTSLTSVTIPDSVTEIGAAAFQQCESLTSVTIGNSVTEIGNAVFIFCTSLTSFNGKFASEDSRCLIVNGVLVAFAPAGLTEYTIPDSVTTIGAGAFYDCNSLTSVTIPGSVTTIGHSAFYRCDSLTSVTIPDSVTTVGGYAFSGCGNLNAVYITDLVAWCNIDFVNPINNGFQLEANPLLYAQNLYLNGELITELVIPESVTDIKFLAFIGCSASNIVFHDNVKSIGACAFERCQNLENVVIGNSVESIGNVAFGHCPNLTSVTMSDSLTSFGFNVFLYSSNLREFKGKLATEDGRALIKDNILFTYANASGLEYTIPDGITIIGDGAFFSSVGLKSITIPKSVTTIGYFAFGMDTDIESIYCKATTPPSTGGNIYQSNSCNIYVPAESYQDYISAGGWRDYADYIVAYDFEKGEVVEVEKPEPGNPDEIENNQIWYTSYGGEVSIRPEAFNAAIVSNIYYGDYGVITFDKELKTIGYYAFYACTSLTSVIIPDSVTSIGEAAFYNCTSLTSVTIPDSVTEIGDCAFQNCTSLTSVTIPDSVTEIRDYAFANCTSLTSFNGKFASEDNRCLIVNGELVAFAPAGLTEYTIPDSVTSIGEGAFAGCTSLTSVTIPDSVTEIGDCAFQNCTSLTSVTIPDNVTEIGDFAFRGCTSLRSVTIPDSVTSIGYGAFADCYSLTSITIPDSVTEIGDYAFSHCSSLTNITIPDSVTEIGEGVFEYCTSLRSVTIPDSVTSIGYAAFFWCTSLTSVTIGNSVTSIGESAFGYCSSLTSFYGKFASVDNRCLIVNGKLIVFAPAGLTEYTIPYSVTEIGELAFGYCTSLTNVTIPDSVTEIGGSAFNGCTSLTSVTIPDSVTEIGEGTFYNCTSLTSVTIPGSVTSIGYDAFAYCTSLKEVYCKPTTPPTGGSSMFYNNASGRKIYVPMESVVAYKSASYWSNYASDIVGYNF